MLVRLSVEVQLASFDQAKQTRRRLEGGGYPREALEARGAVESAGGRALSGRCARAEGEEMPRRNVTERNGGGDAQKNQAPVG